MNRWLAVYVVLLSCAYGAPRAADGDKELKPGPAVDYGKLAFYPKRWTDRRLSTRLVPWRGSQVVLLTAKADLDGKTMARFVDRLDGGWKLYADLVGRSPKTFRQVGGKPSIAAVPDAALTCGLGCGFIGLTGIEVAGFYASDYALVYKQPDAFPHYYFYEMGRNYYLFADRHSLFITGYAVFMRYVCMDALKCDDPDVAMRKVIEQAEQGYADSKLSFVKAFTTLGGLGEKDPRLKGKDGRPIYPSDQPVLYAAAMLKLRKDHGGDVWVKRFLAALARCPEVKPATKQRALRQSLNWLVAASAAARKDLTGVFVDRWRLPLADATRKALEAVDWSRAELDIAQVIKKLPVAFTKE
jgi:hypothetical protein